MSAHTPGPWFVHGDNTIMARIYEHAMVSIATINRNEDDARLIAAAPELLAACKAAERYDNAIRHRASDGDYLLDPLGAVAEGHDLDALYEDWMMKAVAAIAKATGEMP